MNYVNVNMLENLGLLPEAQPSVLTTSLLQPSVSSQGLVVRWATGAEHALSYACTSNMWEHLEERTETEAVNRNMNKRADMKSARFLFPASSLGPER